MKAVVVNTPGDIRFQEVPVPTLNPNEVRLSVKAVGICASDIDRVYGGKAYYYPIILGHEMAGEVIELGSDVKEVKIGDHCTVIPLIPCFKCEWCNEGLYSLCDNYNYFGSRTSGGFAQYLNVPEKNLLILPPEVDFESGAIVEPIAVSVHGLLKVDIKSKNYVLIVGAGSLGLLVAQIARIMGVRNIIVSDLNLKRLKVVEELGFYAVKANSSFFEKINELSNGTGMDLVIEAAGSSQALCNCLGAVRKNGQILCLGLHHDTVRIDQELVNKIVREELSIVGSWNSYSAPFPGIEWDLAIKYLARRLIKVKKIITHRFKLGEAKEAFSRLYAGECDIIKAMFVD
jgi:L-iditol 2-dehydrogenase